jgi:hypothetical protein
LWLLNKLAAIRDAIISGNETQIYEYGKDIIKPMCEFTQYHNYKNGYRKAGFDMADKVTLTLKGYEPGIKDKIKEREVTV